MEEELVLVTTDLAKYRDSDPQYVHVEWGPEFSLHHAVSFPETVPSLVTNLGPLALSYILLEGGSGYFRCMWFNLTLATGELHLVPGAPRFAFPVYATHSTNVDTAALDAALTALRAVAGVQSNPAHRTSGELLANCLARASAIASAQQIIAGDVVRASPRIRCVAIRLLVPQEPRGFALCRAPSNRLTVPVQDR